MSPPIEFDATFNYKYEGSVNLDVNIPRREIPTFCSAFEIAVSERFGATFYYPRYPEEKTRCRYEWFIHHQRDPYGIRISTFFDVGDEDIKELPCLLSWGPRFHKNIGTQFSSATQRKIVKEIQSLWADVNMIINEKPINIWSFLAHINLPPSRGIKGIVDSDLITIYPAVKHKKTETILSAVAVHVPAHFRSQARNLGLPLFSKFVTLLSLLLGTPVEETRIQWPKSFRFENAFEGKDIPQERLYSMNSCITAPNPHHEITETVSTAINLMSQSIVMEDKTLWSSINAFFAVCLFQKGKM